MDSYVGFYKWEEIYDEKIVWILKPKASSYHLFYNYPVGKADIDLRFLDTDKEEIKRQIRIYRERYKNLNS